MVTDTGNYDGKRGEKNPAADPKNMKAPHRRRAWRGKDGLARILQV